VESALALAAVPERPVSPSGSLPDCRIVFTRSIGAVAVLDTAPATPPDSSFPTSSFVNVVWLLLFQSRAKVYSDSASSTKARCTNASNAAAAFALRRVDESVSRESASVGVLRNVA
jgi:hypothetical protein